MKCGTQSAHMSMIHRRSQSPALAASFDHQSNIPDTSAGAALVFSQRCSSSCCICSTVALQGSAEVFSVIDASLAYAAQEKSGCPPEASMHLRQLYYAIL